MAMLDLNTALTFTRMMDRNGNNMVDRDEARVLGSVGNRNGSNGTRETAESLQRGEAALDGFQLGQRDADELARTISQSDSYVSSQDLTISNAARQRIDGMAGGAIDGRISRAEFSAAMQRGGFALSRDGLSLSSEVQNRFGRPTPPPVDRPVPPPVDRPLERSRALEDLDLAVAAANSGYTNRANDAFSLAINEAVDIQEARVIGERAGRLGYMNRANDAFLRATQLGRSSDEVFEVARTAAGLGYTNRANDAFLRAIQLTDHSGSALEIATAAARLGYMNRANDAYDRASTLSRSSYEALDIANSAASAGYVNRANAAYSQALRLATRRSEATEIASSASSRGYVNRANEAFDRAMRLP